MSDFSQLLEKYIKRNKMSVKAASEYLNINRTTLQHVISGDRNLKNIQTAKDVGNKLMLTTDELNDFLNKYKISIMGESVYKRRQKVQNLLSQMECARSYHSKITNVADFILEDEIVTFRNRFDLDKYLRSILNAEINNQSEILILAQPSEYLNCLIYSCSNNSKIKSIKHFFCMDNNLNPDNANENNLDILYCSFLLASAFDNYVPLYYYDNISSHINSNSMLPYCIVTDKYVVAFDVDFSYGISYSDSTTINFYKEIMEKYERNSLPLFSTISNCTDLLGFYSGIGESKYEYYYQPCILVAVPNEILVRHINLPADERISYLKFMNYEYQKYLNNHPYNYFSEFGLKEFIDSGTIYEIPEHCYTKPNPEERRAILAKMIELLDNDIMNYRIYKSNVYTGNGALTINVADSFIRIIFRNKLKTIHLSVSEPGIIYSFKDYFDFMSVNDMIYSKEETLKIMRKYTDE